MSLNLHAQMLQDAAAHNQSKNDVADDRLLKRHAMRQMQELVADVVEHQCSTGALDHLNHEELQLLTKRLPDLTADDFKLVEAIVEALIPKPTGKTISLENEGINIPDDPAQS